MKRSRKPPERKGGARPIERPSKWIVRAALVGIALVAYADSFGLGLAGDARAIVQEDSRIREVSAENLKLILQKDYWWPLPSDLYRPVTTASLLFNDAVLGNGETPGGYHLLNFLLHAFNALLAYELALLLLKRRGSAFFAAALWAAHPIATEAVTNVAGRADLLAAMCVLGGLLLYIRSASLTGRRRIFAAAALFAVATAGVFSKENAAVLAGLIVLWDLTAGRETPASLRQRWPAYAAVALSLAVLGAARYAVFRALPTTQRVYLDNPIQFAGFWTARFTAVKVIGLYLWLLAFPIHLSSDYSYNQISLSGWRDLTAWFAALALVAIVVLVAARFRKDRLMVFAAGFFGISLLPVSNLVFPIGSIMAERFLYLPSLGFALAAAALAYRAPRRKFAIAALAALLLFYVARTWARNLDWQDNLTLASADLQTAPRSFKLHDMYAKAVYEKEGDRGLDAAIRAEEVSWAMVEKLPLAYSSELPPAYLGIYYGFKAINLGTPSPASRPWYEKSIAALLRAREISESVGQAYDQAQLAHGKPLALRSGMPLMYSMLGNDYLTLGRNAEAIEALRHGAGIDPNFTMFYDGMANAWLAMGRPDSAAAALEQMALVEGFKPATTSAILRIYAGMPDAACAVQGQGREQTLNFACARVQSDVCQASAELAREFVEARKPESSAAVRSMAAQRFGCPAEK